MLKPGESEPVIGWLLDASVAPGAKLRQGDLIVFRSSQDPIRTAGIVITADCDLANNKHAKLVTLVPVVSTKTILEYYLIPEDCEKKREQIESFVAKSLFIDTQNDISVREEMIEAKIQADKGEMDLTVKAGATFCLNTVDCVSVGTYKQLMLAIGTQPKKAKSFLEQLKNRGDVLILPDTRKLNLDLEVAWVRHIWQVPLSDIALRTSELTKRSGERIARLDSPFRYRLTQQMGQVFSDIGLPDVPSLLDGSVEKALND